MKKGFTLIELMITIAIVGILAAIAVPSYLSYISKSRFAEIVNAATSLRAAVGTCLQVTGSSDACSSNNNGIPGPTEKVGNLASLVVREGTIYATGNIRGASYSYILSPELRNGTVLWTVSSESSCLKEGLCTNVTTSTKGDTSNTEVESMDSSSVDGKDNGDKKDKEDRQKDSPEDANNGKGNDFKLN